MEMIEEKSHEIGMGTHEILSCDVYNMMSERKE